MSSPQSLPAVPIPAKSSEPRVQETQALSRGRVLVHVTQVGPHGKKSGWSPL